MKKLWALLKPALLSITIFTLLCGILYPGLITGIAQLAFHKQANGSILTITLKNGTQKDYGSELIAQQFTKLQYLIGRPSGPTNLSPSGAKLQELVKQRVDWWHSFDPDNNADIPMDLVTASGSGVDPNISPEAAEYQVTRIARERNISEDTVRSIIKKYTKGRFLGFWGSPAVNVLKVNLALDGLID